ncbi:TetR family transcriptional regulator [Planobispora longispora]|uniref:TetR family transcriptional regulator n=1 Tax=Planobispora longispora TaxID=28887 RepID=A0A8J3RPN6_9ACTN|nr:TetR family transcriptional regulator [Planobispora longispora]
MYEAALTLYGEAGWAGFSLDAVARRARVGKAGLYSRWGSKERLIVDALAAWIPPRPSGGGPGPLREELIRLATAIFDSYFDPVGLVYLRAQLEAMIYPDLFGQALERLQRERIRLGRAIVLRAVERGELPEGTSPALVLDSVSGILSNHVLSTPASQRRALLGRRDEYVEQTVDFVLSAVGYRAQGRDGLLSL